MVWKLASPAVIPSCGRGLRLLFVAAVLMLSTARGQAQSSDRVKALVGRTIVATVVSIVDGDTVHVSLENRAALVVRLDGIDTPERGEPFSAQATRATRVLLFAKNVTMTGTDVDRYGRLVARLRVDGVDVSERLVQQGLACHFTRYSSDGVLAAAQQDAKRRAAGFWAQGVQQPSCARGVSARALGATVVGPFHGNTSSRVFHSPACKNYNCRNCTVIFATESEASAAGFKPAGDCLR